MSEFKLKNGMKLYYEDSGSGQPVIMMHGWTSSHEIYSEPADLQWRIRLVPICRCGRQQRNL